MNQSVIGGAYHDKVGPPDMVDAALKGKSSPLWRHVVVWVQQANPPASCPFPWPAVCKLRMCAGAQTPGPKTSAMASAKRFKSVLYQSGLGRPRARERSESLIHSPTGNSNMPTKTQTKREEYTAKMKHQLDDLNTKMNELEAKTKEAKADAREKY